MRHILFLLLFFTTILSSNPYKNITTYTLENGLKVYLYPDAKSENTAIKVDVKVGVKAEDEKTSGLSHLVEHIVFRDARIEDRDYLDLYKKEGASYVNGYTKYFTTEYVTTIKSDKSYWIVKQFSQMILDKNVSDIDLDAERGALQVEIGDYTWLDKFAPYWNKLYYFSKDILPPKSDFYKDEFKLDIKEERDRKHYSKSIYRANNKIFTLKDVLKHYNDYYYPSNMTLTLVGNFDTNKMKEVIKNSFGKFADKTGKSVEHKIYKIAQLNNKPYKKYSVGETDRSHVVLGTKLVSDDPKKAAILKSYVKDLAKRVNKVFRNKNGESYGAFGVYNHHHNGAVALVSFNSEHSSLDKNIRYTKDKLEKETQEELSDEIIDEALKHSKEFYDSQEHSANSLMDLVYDYRSFHKSFDTNSSPYSVLESVTKDEFRETIKKAFNPNNSYLYIARDYHFFQHDGVIFLGASVLLMIYLLNKLFGKKIKKRILLERRLTSKFVSFFILLSALILSIFVSEWIIYFMIKLFPISSLLEHGYDTPLSYIVYLVDFLISFIVLYFIVKKLYKWYFVKFYSTEHTLIFEGSKNRYIPLYDIKDIEVTPWKIALLGKIHGISLMFWKPLVKITSTQNDVIYLRAKNAKELKSDLEYIRFSKDRRAIRW